MYTDTPNESLGTRRGPPDPGAPVAGLGIRPGEDTDIATQSEGSYDEEVARVAQPIRRVNVAYPFEQTSCVVCFEKDGRNLIFLGAKGLVSHLREVHPTSTVAFTCSGCQKEFPSYQGAANHRRYCKKPAAPNPVLQFACECGKSFDKQTGLSQHERHNTRT